MLHSAKYRFLRLSELWKTVAHLTRRRSRQASSVQRMFANRCLRTFNERHRCQSKCYARNPSIRSIFWNFPRTQKFTAPTRHVWLAGTAMGGEKRKGSKFSSFHDSQTQWDLADLSSGPISRTAAFQSSIGQSGTSFAAPNDGSTLRMWNQRNSGVPRAVCFFGLHRPQGDARAKLT